MKQLHTEGNQELAWKGARSAEVIAKVGEIGLGLQTLVSEIGLVRNLLGIAAKNAPEQLTKKMLREEAKKELLKEGAETVAEKSVPAAEKAVEKAASAAENVAQSTRLPNPVSNSIRRTADHIFGPKSLAKHKLEPVLEKFGGDAVKATYRLQNSAQELANQGRISGIFETTVDAAGHDVTIRGAVINGVAHLRTAFIP